MNKFHNNEKGQTALETAIILIAFIVVASVFAFTILSAGTASTERGEQAVAAGLEGVQASMALKGKVLAEGAANLVTVIHVSVSLAAGGDPVNVAEDALIIGYRDADTIEAALDNADWVATFLSNNGTADDLLEEGELVDLEITVPAAWDLGPNTEFTLEIKPQTGAVLNISRTTPAAIEEVMEL
jgi:flagellin FlaB